MTAPDLLPCPFCGGGITSVDGKGQLWRGVNGYSAPQWYQLNHYGKLSETDDFPRCNVEFRCRTEAEAIAAWNTRATPAPAAMTPDAMRKMIVQAVRFANAAAGEGITIDSLSPELFLLDYSEATGDEDWHTLADRVNAALRAGGVA